MSSKINSVIVQMPNGRRQSLKVNLDSSVLQILEDVCVKHGFNSNEYSLKHHNKVLDPTSVVRFCSLPNNAFLEMVPNTKQVQDPSSKVILSLQVDGEDGRLTGEFPSDWNLELILSSLYPRIVVSDSDKVPVVVYMRREIVGLEALKTTTLRSLGLTSGRALLRLTVRDSEQHPELRCSGVSILNRSSVSVPKVATPANLGNESEPSAENPRHLSSISCGLSIHRPTFSSQSIPAAEIVAAAQLVDKVIGSASSSKEKGSVTIADQAASSRSEEKSFSETKQTCSTVPLNKGSKKETSRKTPSPTPMDVEVPVTKSQKPEIKLDDVKYLDERNGLVFPLEDSSASFSADVPDSFFEITIEDLKLMMRDLKRNRESMENKPLRTEALRQSEQQNKIRTYGKTIVRIQFPDRYVLQGVFNPYDTIADVTNFVRRYLRDPNCEFHLYTSPPKKILPLEDSLLEVECVPCAKIYFAPVNQNSEAGVSNNFLHDKVLPHVTSQHIASFAAGQIRRLSDDKRRVTIDDSSDAVEASTSTNVGNRKNRKNSMDDRIGNATAGGSLSLPSTSPSTNQLPEKQSSNSSQPGKVPKWFKPV